MENSVLARFADACAKAEHVETTGADGKATKAAVVPIETLNEVIRKANAEFARAGGPTAAAQIGFVAESPADMVARAKGELNTPDFVGLKRLGATRVQALRQALTEAMASPYAPEVGTQKAAALATLVNDLARTKSTTTTGVTTGAGLTPYSLEVPAYLLWPVITPLRNRTPRRTVGGVQAIYKRVLGIDTLPDEGWTAEASASTTGRASAIAIDTDQQSATFKKIGLEDFYTFEAMYGTESKIDGANFQAPEVAGLASLQALMMREERAMLGANGGQDLGKPTGLATKGTGTGKQAATGIGSLTASTAYDVYVSALSLAGLMVYKAKGRVSGTDAKGETDASTVATITTTAGGNPGDTSITVSWNAVKGAVAYNLYICATGGTPLYVKTVYAADATAAAITAGTAQTTILTLGTAGHTVNTADLTKSANAYDGFISLVSFNGGVLSDGLGQGFTGDNKQGVVEIDSLFKTMYDASTTNKGPLGVQRIYTSSSDRKAIDNVILGSTAPAFTVFVDNGGGQVVKGGLMVTSLLNRYLNEQVDLETHPYLPAGSVCGVNESLGNYFPNAKIPAGWEMLMGYDSIRTDYGLSAQKVEWGIYSFGAPVMRVPFSHFMLYNTGNV